jgi:hypothetical protein
MVSRSHNDIILTSRNSRRMPYEIDLADAFRVFRAATSAIGTAVCRC